MHEPTWINDLPDIANLQVPTATDLAAVNARLRQLHKALRQERPKPGDYLYHVEDQEWIRLETPTTIGRKSSSTVQIKRPWISNQHCKIYREDGEWFVQDLQSTNGTRLNKCKIQSNVLHNGDEIAIDRTRFVFVRMIDEEPPAS